ncbi:hypothetical protein, partial [Shewanella algae]
MKLCTIHWRESTAAARVEGDHVVVLEEHADVGALLRAGGVEATAGVDGPTIALDEVRFAPLVLAPSKI